MFLSLVFIISNIDIIKLSCNIMSNFNKKNIECFRESIIKFDKILLQLKNSKKIKDNHITFFIYTIYFKVFCFLKYFIQLKK